MREIFSRVCSDFDAVLIEIDGEKDPVHLLVNYVPKTSVSRLVNSLKGVSSRILKKRHTDIRRAYWKNALWSPSYFAASCGSAPVEIIKQYAVYRPAKNSSMIWTILSPYIPALMWRDFTASLGKISIP